MADKSKSKQAAALQKIKDLATSRSTSNRPGGEPSGPSAAKGGKRAPKRSAVGHRPQGG